MALNPTLKNVLVRIAYIVGSLIIYCLLTVGSLLISENFVTRFPVFWIGQAFFTLAVIWGCIYKLDSVKPLIAIIGSLIVCYIVYRSIDYLDFSCWKDNHAAIDGHPTLRTFLLTIASAILIWINIRKLSLPVKRVSFAIFLLVPTFLIGAWKTGILYNMFYFDAHYYLKELSHWGVVSVLASSLLPLFFTGKEVIKLDRASKIGLWGVVLLLNFVIAMPNIIENEFIKPRIYHSYYGKFYMIKRATNCFLLSMQDTQKYYYYDDGLVLKRHYFNDRDSLWVSSDEQDTLYIQRDKIHFISYRVSRPNGETYLAYPYSDFIEEATNCWQYNAWHKIKGLFNKEENE